MKRASFLVPVLVVLAVVACVTWAVRTPASRIPTALSGDQLSDLTETIREVDGFFSQRWRQQGLTPANPADDILVYRRLSLALHGTIPSLEELRRFEADQKPYRLKRWTAAMLDDNRFADYFAERLARCYVGTEGGQFIVYRRDRFVDWLAEQLRANRPYDEIVREIIAGQGLWTGSPATNFVTAAVLDGDVDESKLAGRCVRAFLGQRMDCAQCHDHPFADWKQSQFEGLAAHFGQTKISVFGVEDKTRADNRPVEYEIEDRDSAEKRLVPPAVPFHPEWLPESGSRREQLAVWITHPSNRRFERAIANRIWGLLFGRPFVEPVDDLPDPRDSDDPDLLDILGTDFRKHNCDLRRLILVITSSRPFRLQSRHPLDEEASSYDPESLQREMDRLEANWAVFPLTRLRPEQVIGAMLQAGSIKTIDRNSHLIVRAIRFLRENDFIREYGDLGEEELAGHAGTIPQALLRMNGRLPQEIGSASLLTAAGRILAVAHDDETCLEACFLICASRHPTTAEKEYFLEQLQGTSGPERPKVIEDLIWSLFNSEEFSWNH